MLDTSTFDRLPRPPALSPLPSRRPRPMLSPTCRGNARIWLSAATARGSPQPSPTARCSSRRRGDVAGSRWSSSHVEGSETGTATTMRAGPSRRSAATAARMVEPVARPSSTRITVRPRTSTGGRSPRYSRSRRSSSARSSTSTSSIKLSASPSAWTISSLSTRTPPKAIAPIARSSCPGTPSLRTTKTSSGAPSRRATS